MTLKAVVRSYPPLIQALDGYELAQESIANSRKKFAASVELLVEAWNDWRDAYDSRKRALHRAIG
jgi:hypothetical protein